MIDPGNVRSETKDRIATITFFHPKSNSLPGALLARLAEEVKAAGENRDARVIVLRSEGDKAFCAGASFDELKAITNAEDGKRFFSGFATLILAMIRCPKFIVTRVQSKAVGGAVGVIAASDYVIASEAASLRLSELAVGIGPFIVGLPIERKIGLAAFSAMAVDADWRDARWGERHGLYAELYPGVVELDAAVEKRAKMLADSNPEAMEKLKKIFWAGTQDWESKLAERVAMSGTLVLSEFTRRAIQK
ncbi:MAG TPA: enoyl-CoA hydratase/isomerase family protein [Gemmatimonadaceae bacterium]|jgi:methylglutaconyl-CoA hydratase